MSEMTVGKSALITLFIWLDAWLKITINRAISVFFNEFYASVISNALTALKDEVPDVPNQIPPADLGSKVHGLDGLTQPDLDRATGIAY